MILIRDVFQAKYGKGDELVAVIKGGMSTWTERELRILTDVSGPFFTVVTEEVVESLDEWERNLAEAFKNPEFAEWFAKMEPLVRSGSRQFYRIE
jgi:hypothetical protein